MVLNREDVCSHLKCYTQIRSYILATDDFIFLQITAQGKIRTKQYFDL